MLQLGIRGLGIARFKFNPISWFAKGEQGAWYDPSDLTTLFQDSAGTTPVTAVEQPVGLMLDKSRGLALGAELVTNGGFATDTGWTKGTGWTITGGQGVLTAGAGILQQTMGTVVVGTSYTVSINTNLAIQLRVGSANIGYFSPVNNTILCFITAIAGALIEIIPNGTQTGYVDNISVKKIAGNHAFQATAGNRPVLSARVNLLTKTEDFSDAVWASTASNITVLPNYTTAPNGTLTADKIVGTSGTVSPHYVGYGSGNLTGLAIGVVYRASIYIKAAGITTASINFYATIANVDLTAVTISGVGSTIDPVGDGWYKCTMLHTATATSEYFVLQSGATYTGDGANGIYAWGADIRPTNSGALLPPYQRVNTASDYDTVGFPLYLKANGTSSAMSTNSIDFSSTDKMTVVTGVRKLSDASLTMIMELSAVLSIGGYYLFTNAGSVYGYAVGGTVIGGNSTGTYPAPSSDVVTLQDNISQPQVIFRVDGTVKLTNNISQGLGTFGNYPLYLFSRNQAQYFLNGNFYGAIIRGAASDTASVTQTENYMATKTGITF